jgi:hypothetical protein
MKQDNILTTKESLFMALLVLGNVLTLMALSTRDKEGIFFFAPGMLIVTCTLCVTGVIAVVRRSSNMLVRGAFVGLLCGGILGALGILQPLFFFLAYTAQGGVGALCCAGIGSLIGALGGYTLRNRRAEKRR